MLHFSSDEELWGEQFSEIYVERIVKVIFAELGFAELLNNCLLSVTLTNDHVIADVNSCYRGVHTPTNVIAFSYLSDAQIRALCSSVCKGSDVDKVNVCENLETAVSADCDSDRVLGEVIVSYETVAREVESFGMPFEDRFVHMLVHGVLHVLGYDHQNDADAAKMEACEVRLMNLLGYSDPYVIS